MEASTSEPQRQQKTQRIVLMGPRASGKTSIVDFLVKKTLARETLFLDSTRRPNYSYFEAFTPFELVDMPGNQLEPEAFKVWPKEISAAIFVLDGQSLPDASPEVANSVARSIVRLCTANPTIQIYVFVHKMETGTPDGKLDMREDLRLRLEDGMEEELPDTPSHSMDLPNVNYCLTSVYDHTVFESMSKVIQRLLPCQFAVERILDILCQNSGIDKAFLFHLPTKLYVGTDSSPVDSHSHNICSDLIDLFVDFGSLYGTQQAAHQIRQKQADGNANSQPSSKPAAPAPIRRAATNRVKMSNGLTLAHWEIDEKLSLLAMLRPDVIENQSALVEFNVDIFRQSIFQIQRVEAGEYDEAGEDD